MGLTDNSLSQRMTCMTRDSTNKISLASYLPRLRLAAGIYVLPARASSKVREICHRSLVVRKDTSRLVFSTVLIAILQMKRKMIS